MRSSVQASFFATKIAVSTCGWTNRATSALLEALKTRESHWNTKFESYENRNTKKKHYDEIVVILKEDCAQGRTHHLSLRFLRYTTSLIIRNTAIPDNILACLLLIGAIFAALCILALLSCMSPLVRVISGANGLTPN